MFNMICAKKLKQSHGVLDYSTYTLNKMKLKDALGRVEYMEDVVKTNEVLSCPKCRKNKGVMVDCANCTNLEKEVSYLKSSLNRFSEGKKQLNMILDQSKVTSYNRGVGFSVHDYFTKNQPNVFSITERGEILTKPSEKKTVLSLLEFCPIFLQHLKKQKQIFRNHLFLKKSILVLFWQRWTYCWFLFQVSS